MRRLITIACAGALMATAGAGCYVKKETVREPTTTIERRSSVETVPRDTEVRTKTTVEHEY